LVPISSLAEKLGIETPAIDTVVRLANIMTGRNFIQEGRTVEKLGLKNMSVSQILEFAQTGELTATVNQDEEVVA
jgi:opine dehydrogenase